MAKCRCRLLIFLLRQWLAVNDLRLDQFARRSLAPLEFICRRVVTRPTTLPPIRQQGALGPSPSPARSRFSRSWLRPEDACAGMPSTMRNARTYLAHKRNDCHHKSPDGRSRSDDRSPIKHEWGMPNPKSLREIALACLRSPCRRKTQSSLTARYPLWRRRGGNSASAWDLIQCWPAPVCQRDPAGSQGNVCSP